MHSSSTALSATSASYKSLKDAKSVMSLKAASHSRSLEEKQSSDRQKDILVLILHHLQSFGYIETATHLQKEAGQVVLKYECADNMDIMQILREYEEYYEMKCGRKPKFSRRSTSGFDGDEAGNNSGARSGGRKGSRRISNAAAARRRGSQQQQQQPPSSLRPMTRHQERYAGIGGESGLLSGIKNRLGVTSDDILAAENRPSTSIISGRNIRGPDDVLFDEKKIDPDGNRNNNNGDGVSGVSLKMHKQLQQGVGINRSNANNANDRPKEGAISSGEWNERIIKPLPDFGGDMEMKSLAAAIQRDILQTSPGVDWDDIVELHDAKRVLKEAVVMPLKYPQLFTGLLTPWCGILLYGPPGTGKTLLAKAVATQSNTTFFNISASSIVSKFRGDSEKLVRILFELARYHSPSTIFIDEIDSIMGHRGGGGFSSGGGGGAEGGEHEGSRRMKTELLIQMDGVAKGRELVFLLAASNLPWDLDPALLRRLEKRIFISLPDHNSRKSMLMSYLSAHQSICKDEDVIDHVSGLTDGYSGADIKLLCKEAAMRPVRRILNQLEQIEMNTKGSVVPSMKVTDLLHRNKLTADDLKESFSCTSRSTGSEFCEKYFKWAEQFGST